MDVDPESSFELIQRAQSGDQDALDRLITRYRPRLRRWASGRLPHYARGMTDTDDIVQDVLIKTVQNLPDFGRRGEWALQAYLRRGVVNRIRDELDKANIRPRPVELPETLPAREPSPLQAAIGTELFARYEAALAALGEVECEAVLARIELGCSYQEIAALVGKPTPDAARMMVARALTRLATLMADGAAAPDPSGV